MQVRIENPALTVPGAMACTPARSRRRASRRRASTPSVPDEVWEEAARHYDDSQLAALVISIATINAWNQINAATRQITGDWVGRWISPEAAGEAA